MKKKGCFRGGCLTVAVVIGIPFSLWIGCEIFHSVTSNPGEARTYRAYRAKLPAPKSAERWVRDGTNYVAVYGPIRAKLALPSGLPVYVFDADGNMVDWTLDSGDDGRFQKAWSRIKDTRMSVTELDSMMNEGVEQRRP
jgi:hypothetical protein